jgi:hypothetical protein
MLLNNKHKYPQAVVEACKAEIYRPLEDTLRVTELIDSPLIKRLLIEHWKDLSTDVDDIVYSSLFGTAWHKFVAEYEPAAMVEHRWYTNLPDGKVLTGATDIYKPDEGIIEDNKTQSVWAFVFGTPSWERQLNVYAHLIEANGYPVRELWINSFLRDWSKFEAMRNRKDYPKHKFHKVRCRLWDKDKRDKFIQDRINIHNDPTYVCSDEERWRRATTWAVKKKGTKTARRVLDTEKAAKLWIEENKPKGNIYIEERVGSCVRCEEWCPVRSVCIHKEEINETDAS